MDLTSTIQHSESDDVESAIFWRTVNPKPTIKVV